jgi:cell division protein ZapA
LKKRFNIKLLGQEFAILSDSGDEEVARIVDYINGKAEEIGKSLSNPTTLNIAILVSLNIADEFFRLKGEKENIYNQLENKSERLIDFIDNSFKVIPCDARD